MSIPHLLSTQQITIDSSLSQSSSNAVSNATVTTALATKEDKTTVVTNSNTTVSLTLDNNHLYQLTSSSLSSLTISGVSTGFAYASIQFSSPSTATTFSMPESGYYCIGAGCASGTFTPEADMRYNLAIFQESDRIAIYIMEAL